MVLSHDGDRHEADIGENSKKTFNMLTFFLEVWTKPLEAWTRRWWGAMYMDFRALLGMAFMPLFGAFTFPGKPNPWMGLFFLLTIAMLVRGNINGFIQRRRLRAAGAPVHSRYSGKSIFSGSDWAAKTLYEPALLMLVGGLIFGFSPGLGAYLLGGGVAMSFVYAVCQEQEKTRLRRMEDARIEAEYYASKIRQDD